MTMADDETDGTVAGLPPERSEGYSLGAAGGVPC